MLTKNILRSNHLYRNRKVGVALIVASVIGVAIAFASVYRGTTPPVVRPPASRADHPFGAADKINAVVGFDDVVIKNTLTNNGTSTFNGATSLANLAMADTFNFSSSITPATLPAQPTVTDHWNPWGSGTRTTFVRVTTAAGGSILGSLLHGNIGDVVILENHGDSSGAYGHGELQILAHKDTDPTNPDNIYSPDFFNLVVPYTGSIGLYYDGPVGWIPIFQVANGRLENAVIDNMILVNPITATLAAGENVDFDPPGGEFGNGQQSQTWLRVNGNAGGSILGGIVPYICPPADPVCGNGLENAPVRILTSIGGNITISNEDTNELTQGNRINTPGGNNIIVPSNSTIGIYYDQQGGGSLNQGRWRVLFCSGCQTAITATQVTISGTGTLTVGGTSSFGQAITAAGISSSSAISTTGGAGIVAAGNLVGSGNVFVGNAGKGHFHATGSSVVISACGTGPLCQGTPCTDVAGSIIVGTGTTTCTVTFANAYTATKIPHCVLGSDTGLPLSVTRSVSSLVVTNASLSGSTFTYICAGEQND